MRDKPLHRWQYHWGGRRNPRPPRGCPRCNRGRRHGGPGPARNFGGNLGPQCLQMAKRNTEPRNHD
eukprot:8376892-Lingulodinium_polyedra.AAC.1